MINFAADVQIAVQNRTMSVLFVTIALHGNIYVAFIYHYIRQF